METIRTSNVLVEEAAHHLGITCQVLLVTFLQTLECYSKNEDLLERAVIQWSNLWYGEQSRIPRAFEEYCWHIVQSSYRADLLTPQSETQVDLKEAA